MSWWIVFALTFPLFLVLYAPLGIFVITIPFVIMFALFSADSVATWAVEVTIDDVPAYLASPEEKGRWIWENSGGLWSYRLICRDGSTKVEMECSLCKKKRTRCTPVYAKLRYYVPSGGPPGVRALPALCIPVGYQPKGMPELALYVSAYLEQELGVPVHYGQDGCRQFPSNGGQP